MNCCLLFACTFVLVVNFSSSNTFETKKSNLAFFSSRVNRFSAKFYETLAGKSRDNVVTSPISALMVLAMATYGANGITRKESMDTLQLPVNQKNVLDGFKDFITDLQNPKKVELHLANKLFVQKKFPINANFANTTAIVFQSKTENIDFGNALEAAGIINDWCQHETKDKIKNVIKPDDLKDAQLVMVNAVYFRGKWAKPFESDLIDLPFHRSKNDSVIVPMMCKTIYNADRLLDDDALYVELPYETGDPKHGLSMYIIIPMSNKNLDDIADRLHEIDFTKLESLEEESDFCMPKFKIESELQIIPILQAMGIHNMFEDSADFSNLTPVTNLKISKVIQKAFLSVDEKGSEAAAATGAGFSNRMSSRILIDRPFIAAIIEKTNGTPLFWARVNNL